MPDIRLESKDLDRLAKDLKALGDSGKIIRRDMAKGLRAAAKPLVPALQSEVMKIKSKGLTPSASARANRQGKTLRATMRKSVTIKVRTTGKQSANVQVFMNPKKMPDGMKSLPAYFEMKPGYTRLRHPTFGNKERWSQQTVPNIGYFTRTVRPALPNAIREINKVVDDIERKVKG